MKKNEGNTAISLILAIVVLLLVAFILYDKVFVSTNNNEQNTNIAVSEETKVNLLENNNISTEKEETTVYSFEKISGLYEFSDDKAGYSLYLWENGTFKYEYSDLTAPRGFIGNYTITNNTINLNNLLTTGSDTGLYVTKGEHTLTINSDDSITDSNTVLEQRSVTLKKATLQEEREYLDIYNIYNIMKNGDIINHY